MNAALVDELLAWDIEIGKDGWNGAPVECVGKAGGQENSKEEFRCGSPRKFVRLCESFQERVKIRAWYG